MEIDLTSNSEDYGSECKIWVKWKTVCEHITAPTFSFHLMIGVCVNYIKHITNYLLNYIKHIFNLWVKCSMQMQIQTSVPMSCSYSKQIRLMTSIPSLFSSFPSWWHVDRLNASFAIYKALENGVLKVRGALHYCLRCHVTRQMDR